MSHEIGRRQATLPWDGATSHARVLLEDVALDLKIGATDWERHPDKRQRVLATVEGFFRQGAFTGSTLADVLDYDRLYRHLMGLQQRPHTDLLETLVEDIVQACLADPRVEACRVLLRKPDIYWNAAASGVEFYRVREG